MSYFNYERRLTHPIEVGCCKMGGENPIVLQSMANTSTLDTNACVEQAIEIIEAGGEMVRFTAQGEREAANLGLIRAELNRRGYYAPLVADIHFNPKAADRAAVEVEKVRINPGNYVESAKRFAQIDYTDEEYNAELLKIRQRFLPFLALCREHHTALRIGVNHGSLSDRIMSRYGDTVEGMVESCLEFLRLCKEVDFNAVVLSVKASNSRIMVQTVRSLVCAMEREEMYYPLHLGVTEAGEGEDGRIRSAVGIGTLLADGIGDTIRVSLSESPAAEIPVARRLVQHIVCRMGHKPIVAQLDQAFNVVAPLTRETVAIHNIGGDFPPVVVMMAADGEQISTVSKGDYLFIGNKNRSVFPSNVFCIQTLEAYRGEVNAFPLFDINQWAQWESSCADLRFLKLDFNALSMAVLLALKKDTRTVLVVTSSHLNPVGELRAFLHTLLYHKISLPVILAPQYRPDVSLIDLQIEASADMGALLLDGFTSGIGFFSPVSISVHEQEGLLLGILQATGLRISKTEFISCPGCGRTLYNLQESIAEVKAATAHLKGLKIAVMGCIVNGPGEMADAHYGYVGAGRGKVNLYKGKVCKEKNIDQRDAVNRLVLLIKENGDWKEQ